MDFPIESPQLPGWVDNEVRQSILRDRNRACVVQWELFNELKRPVLMRLLHPMAMLARQLDPTRLILDESGGWAQGANMYLPYQTVPTKFNDIHDYPGPQINDDDLREAAPDRRQDPRRDAGDGPVRAHARAERGPRPDDRLLRTGLRQPARPRVDNNRRFAEIGNPIVPPTVYHRRLADQHRRR